MKRQSAPQKLSESLLKLAETKSIEKITIKEIVRECGLSSQTFYNHFPDKYALVLYVHKSAGDEMLKKLLYDKNYTFRDLTIENLTFYADHADFMINALTSTSGPDSYWIQSSENAIQVLDQYIRLKFSKQSLTEEEAVHLRMYVYACTAIYAYWVDQNMAIPVQTLSDYLISAIPDSMRKYLI